MTSQLSIEDFHSSKWLKEYGSSLHLLCAAFTGAISLFGAQKVLQKRLPYPLQWNLLVSIGGEIVDDGVQRPSSENTVFLFWRLSLFSSVASSAASYAVTRWETQKCSDLWLLLETGKVPDRSLPKGQYNVWLQCVFVAAKGWHVPSCLALCFSVQGRRIRKIGKDKIWRRYGINNSCYNTT